MLFLTQILSFEEFWRIGPEISILFNILQEMLSTLIFLMYMYLNTFVQMLISGAFMGRFSKSKVPQKAEKEPLFDVKKEICGTPLPWGKVCTPSLMSTIVRPPNSRVLPVLDCDLCLCFNV